ncbi:RICIN domain-containing protein [Streptomyces sp. NPDC004244]
MSGQGGLVARYKNLATGKCLDVRDESRDDYAVVQQYSCKDGSQQSFGIGPNVIGGSPFYTYRSYKCVEPRDGTYDGAGVQQWTCNGGMDQLWDSVPLKPGIVTLRHRWSGKCLQDMGHPDGKRREVGLMPCTYASDQAWRLA